MNDDDLLRYSRHLLLDDIGIEGQRRLLAAHALVIGAGGLGSPVALYLGSAGVGRITIVDDDRVDLTNLQRQIAHDLARVGAPKAESAARSIAAINPDGAGRRRCTSAPTRAACSSSSPTPTWSSTAATTSRPGMRSTPPASRTREPLVVGRGDRLRRPALGLRHASCRRRPATPACFRRTREFADVACATMGVFAPLVGIIGSMQAAEALKLLAGIGTLARRSPADARRAQRWNGPRCASRAIRPARSARRCASRRRMPAADAERAAQALS